MLEFIKTSGFVCCLKLKIPTMENDFFVIENWMIGNEMLNLFQCYNGFKFQLFTGNITISDNFNLNFVIFKPCFNVLLSFTIPTKVAYLTQHNYIFKSCTKLTPCQNMFTSSFK